MIFGLVPASKFDWYLLDEQLGCSKHTLHMDVALKRSRISLHADDELECLDASACHALSRGNVIDLFSRERLDDTAVLPRETREHFSAWRRRQEGRAGRNALMFGLFY